MGYSNVYKYLKNSSWLIWDFGVRILGGFFINGYVARELGPELFGRYTSWIIAISFFITCASISTSKELVKNLSASSNEDERKKIIFNSTVAQAIFSFFGFILFNLLSPIFFDGQEHVRVYGAILSTIFFSLPFLVIKSNNESEVNVKKTVIPENITYILGIIIKFYLAKNGFNLIYFIIVYAVELIFSAIFIFRSGNINILDYSLRLLDKKYLKVLMRRSIPLLVTNASIFVYMRSDILIIQSLLGSKDAGLYSVSSRLVEIAFTFGTIVITTIFPKIVRVYVDNEILASKFIHRLVFIAFYCAIVLMLLIYFTAGPLINIVFGQLYDLSYELLLIQMWSIPLVFIGLATGKLYLLRNLHYEYMLISIIGMVISVLINIYMMKIFGLRGAAYTYIFSQIFICFIGDIIFKKTRDIFWFKIKAIKYLFTAYLWTEQLKK